MIDNPFWAEVAHLLDSGWLATRARAYRLRLTAEYSWTVTDPDTVAFVVAHCGPAVVDPLTGSGYWPWLLGQHGVDVLAADRAPPGRGANPYHGAEHVPIRMGDGAAVVAEHGAGRTLLLGWPPFNSATGAQTLAAYPGDRVVYLGEERGGACGTEAMFDVLDTGWRPVASHVPVRWLEVEDVVTVYDRLPTR